MKKLIVVNIILVILMLSTSYSYAKVNFEPRISASESYDDNIFLENNNLDNDWITTVTPGLKLNYLSKILKLDLDYSLYFKRYEKHPDENEDNIRDVQRARVDAVFFPEKDFTLTLREDISRVVIDDRGQATEENELVNKTTLYHFMVIPQYEWRVFPTFRAILGYQYDSYDYVASAGDDAEEHRYRLGLIKDLVTETKVKIDALHEDHRSQRDSDFQLQQVSAGLTQQLGPKWMLDAETGFAWVDFDLEQDVDGSIWMVSIAGEIAKYMNLILATNRTYLVSVDSGLRSRTQSSAVLRYHNAVDAELKAFWREDDYQLEERTDRAYGGVLKCGISLSRKYVLTLKGDIAQYKFLPEDEKALRLGAGTSLEYVGKRVRLALGYTIRNSNSNIQLNDYTNNIATVSGTLRF